MESLLENKDTCHDNPEKPSTTKKNKHTASGNSIFTHCSFDATKISLVITETKIIWKSFIKI